VLGRDKVLGHEESTLWLGVWDHMASVTHSTEDQTLVVHSVAANLAGVFFFKGVLYYDRPNSLLLVIEPVLFINLDICGRFWGKIREFGRNRREKNHWIYVSFVLFMIFASTIYAIYIQI
jgi:hypothetical protein